MLILMCADELRRALADIEQAEANGFTACEAVLEPKELAPMGHLYLRYSDMVEKALPNRSDLNWGRFQGVTKRHRFDGEKLVPLHSVHQE